MAGRSEFVGTDDAMENHADYVGTNESSNEGIADELECEDSSKDSPPRPKSRKLAGAATYKTEFKPIWRKEFPFVSAVPGDPYRFRCNICDKKIKCDHMGKQDVEKHCKTQGHLQQAKALTSQTKLPFASQQSLSAEVKKRTEAELRMAVLGAGCNIPLAFHDSLSPTIRKVFSDSKIAAEYHSASTKATCMLNLAVAPALLKDLLQCMKVQPFSIAIDGSNDTGLEKMNPVTVRIFDQSGNKVVTRFLDICAARSSTADGIYTVLNEKLVTLLGVQNPWCMCTSVGVDNTSVNIGIRDSIKTRIMKNNSAIFFNGCPCHIIHNAAQKAGDAFTKTCIRKFDVEELVIDLYYWFDKSMKRKNGLLSYCTFCDQEYRAIVRHVTTRWLSLLQRDDPLIHILQPQMELLLKNVMHKFIQPSVLVAAIRAGTLTRIDPANVDNHVSDDKLVVGFMAQQRARQLLEDGDISQYQHANFFNAARSFLVCAAQYLLKWCPLNDELLINAKWLSFEDRLDATFNSVEYFIRRYPHLFSNINIDRLQEQFLNYQVLQTEDVPESIKKMADLKPEDPFRVDHLWGWLRGVKKPGTGTYEFDLLFKVAEAVMTIPHSNAGEERIFSQIQKNKTPGRSSLKLDGTLSSLMIVRTHIEDVVAWKPNDSILEKAKKATRAYNDSHRS